MQSENEFSMASLKKVITLHTDRHNILPVKQFPRHFTGGYRYKRH